MNVRSTLKSSLLLSFLCAGQVVIVSSDGELEFLIEHDHKPLLDSS